MSIPELIASLDRMEVTIEVEAGNLRIQAPRGSLSPEIQAELRERKAEIIAYLLEQRAGQVHEEALVRADRRQPIPAASAQRGLWFQVQLEGPGATYNVPVVYRLEGKLDIPILEKSLRYLIARHESLRMSFQAVAGEPALVIHEQGNWELDRHPFEAGTIDRELAEAAARPFSLELAPFFRAHLWTDDASRHLLLLNFHHIILDGWSQGLFESELSSVYNQLAANGQAALPDLEWDYADYAARQQAWLKTKEFEQGLAYWMAAQQGAPGLLELPCDHPRPAVRTYHGGKVSLDLEAEFAGRMGARARRENVTLFMLMHAAYAILLGRYCRQTDVVIGVPMANRLRKELEGMLGFFVNTLPLRLDLGGNPSLPELLGRMRRVALEAYAHQGVPFDRLVAALHPRRDPGFPPVFQVVFDFVNSLPRGFQPGDCTVRSEMVETSTAKFDLSLTVSEQSRGLHLELRYNSDLFERSTAERMLAHYRRILEWMVSAPADRLDAFEILSGSERRTLLEEWNPVNEYPRQATIQSLFEEQAAAAPEAVALDFSDRMSTYRELNERANRLAHRLGEMGVGPEVRVGVYIRRSMEMIVALLAILKAGGVYVPLDPAFPAERLKFILEDTGAALLLTLKAHLPDLSGLDSKRVCVDDEQVYAGRSVENPDVPVSAGNLAYILYTSGSTGRPKGCCIPHRAVVRLVKNTNYADFDPGEVFLQFAPLAFDASTFEIWGSLLNGARLAIFPPGLPGLDELAGFVKTHRVTTLWLPAGLFHQMMDWQPGIVDGLHQLLSGGDVLSPAAVRKALERNPACRMINGYGPTENTTFTCCCTVKEAPEGLVSIPIGRPVAHTRVYILDARRQPVPIGVVGELYTGGDGLAREYLNQPELTERQFVPDPFQPGSGQRMYRTGDHARWLADGNIEFFGRLDDQVKVRGFRIEPGEVESALKLHPGIREACVVAREDTPGNKQLVGYLLPTGERPEPAGLQQFLAVRLPQYMVPSAYVFVDAFPLTPNGKIDRKALPAPQAAGGEVPHSPAGNEGEARLVRIWAEVLGLPSVGTDENFFDLGGNSLLAMRLMAAIGRELNRPLPVVEVFRFPTIRQLARAVQADQAEAAGWSPLVRVRPEGPGRPLFFFHYVSMDMAHALGDRWPIYSLVATDLSRDMEQDKTVEEMAGHYLEAMRTVQPHGPYRLVGYCTGGSVAYEIAQRLEAQGERVSLLVEFEGYAWFTKVHSWKQWIVSVIENLPYWVRRYGPRLMNKLGGVRKNPPGPADEVFAKRFQHHLDLLRYAQENYRPGPYSGHVIVFSSKWREIGQVMRRPADPTLGWGRLARGGVETFSFKGDHENFYYPPYLTPVAAALKKILVRLDDEETAESGTHRP